MYKKKQLHGNAHKTVFSVVMAFLAEREPGLKFWFLTVVFYVLQRRFMICFPKLDWKKFRI